MNLVFLDTSFLIALVRRRDEHHQVAQRWRKSLSGPFLTTEYVLLEFLDSSAPPPLRRRGLEAIRILRGDSAVTIAHCSDQLLEAGVELFRQHMDKAWSLTDCISFAVMRREAIQDALTSDRDFEQAGFRALLRHVPA